MDLIPPFPFHFPGTLALIRAGIYSGRVFLQGGLLQNESSMLSPAGPAPWRFKGLIPIVGILPGRHGRAGATGPAAPFRCRIAGGGRAELARLASGRAGRRKKLRRTT